MKVLQITEATYENISVLQKLAEIVIENTPTIPYGTVKLLYLSMMPQFTNLYREYENNEKFKRAFQTMETTMVIFVNDPEYNDPHYGKNAKWGGYHYATDNVIVIFAYNFTSGRDLELNGYSYKREIKRILVHEFRHLFQHTIYPEYFSSLKAYRTSYDERHIELDATWSDGLGQINYDEMLIYVNDPDVFVDQVMSHMLVKFKKKLSPKLEKHYRIKTLKYFNDFFRKETDKKFRELLSWQEKYLKQYPPTSDITGEINDIADDVSHEIKRHAAFNLGKPLTHAQFQDYKAKARRRITQLLEPNRNEKKVKQYIEKLKPDWEKVLEQYLDRVGEKIKDKNSYAAAGVILDTFMDKHGDFFYSNNKNIYNISQEVRNHFYKRIIEIVNYTKERYQK